MNKKEVFFKDRDECSEEFTHITGNITDPTLKVIDELYGAADVLSIKNAQKHQRILLALSVIGTLITMAFLLYDEAELHGLILACGVMVLCLFFVRRIANRLECHRKYLEYRVLAECLRCQFFLSFAGTGIRVMEILPWSIRKGIPWIAEVLSSISENKSSEKRSVLDPWIRVQKTYHKAALGKNEIKNRKDGRIAKIVLIITIATYVAALLYELLVYRNAQGAVDANLIRALLKIVLGTMSAITLFTGSYYGKMSLSNIIDDHKRMIALYETAEEEILQKGENEELLTFLAREFLNENSTWYSYQSKNGPDLVV